MIQYDTIEEFNVDWKAECGQLNLAHKNKYQKSKKETKTNKCQGPLCKSKIHKSIPKVTRKTMEERICKTDVF